MSPHLMMPLSSDFSVLSGQLLRVQLISVPVSPETDEDFHSYVLVNPFVSGNLMAHSLMVQG